MSQDYPVLSALRSLVIFIAFASAFYFLLVWNPVSTFGDLRHYFEHRVRVPVEWIVLVFPVAWLIQRNHGCAVAAAVFVPISVLILTLTKPDYGAEFWRILRNEVYLDPIYVPRGLLVCFFLLSLILSLRALWNKVDQKRVFLLCLLIGFALTSWEALIAPSPRNTFEGGGRFMGPWTDVIKTGWDTINWYIAWYIPLNYQNAVRIGVSVYPFLAAFLLLSPSYRKAPQDLIREHRGGFPIYLFVGVLVGLSGWAFSDSRAGGVKRPLWNR